MTIRSAHIVRHTSETQVDLHFTLDGTGQAQFKTGIPFLDHMLTLFCVHGLFDLNVDLKGDLEIDAHHSVEDLGICLGQAFKEALGDKKGIRRYASALIPMDEALAEVAVDISNRPYLDFVHELPYAKIGAQFDVELMEEFFRAFVTHAAITAHIRIVKGKNLHHCCEAVFKAWGVILDAATQVDQRKTGVPSSKGIL